MSGIQQQLFPQSLSAFPNTSQAPAQPAQPMQPVQQVDLEGQMRMQQMSDQGYADVSQLFRSMMPEMTRENQNPSQHFATNPVQIPQIPQIQQQQPYVPQGQPVQPMQPMQPMQPSYQTSPQDLQNIAEMLREQKEHMASLMARMQEQEQRTVKHPDFVEANADMDAILADPKNFNDVLQSVYQRAVSDIQNRESAITQQVTAQVQARMEAQNALNNFFTAHPEYSNNQDLVGIALQTVRQRNPHISDARQLLQGVEQMLNIQRPPVQQMVTPQQPQLMAQPVPQMGFAQPLGGISNASPYVTSPEKTNGNQAVLELVANHLFGRS